MILTGKKREFTIKQEKFINEYIKLGNITEAAIAAIRNIYSFVPMVVTILGMILYAFANLDKIAPEVQATIQANRSTAAE